MTDSVSVAASQFYSIIRLERIFDKAATLTCECLRRELRIQLGELWWYGEFKLNSLSLCLSHTHTLSLLALKATCNKRDVWCIVLYFSCCDRFFSFFLFVLSIPENGFVYLFCLSLLLNCRTLFVCLSLYGDICISEQQLKAIIVSRRQDVGPVLVRLSVLSFVRSSSTLVLIETLAEIYNIIANNHKQRCPISEGKRSP